MKTSTAHLPENKQEELKYAVEIILEQVNAEMIILFGSYARGDWVEEPAPDGFHYIYQSDFDLFVLVENKKVVKKVARWKQIRDILRRQIDTPIELLAESIGHFNGCLSNGWYFYTDIKKEGILLYDSQRYQLVEPRQLGIEERRKMAEEDFEQWFGSANGFLRNYKFSLDENEYNIAAFLLHQATERFYSAILLVFTSYKPRTHDIDELGKLTAAQQPEFLKIFPKGTDEQVRLFELLRKAYVDARYKKNYTITRKELEWLGERVRILKEMTERFCKEKMVNFEQGFK